MHLPNPPTSDRNRSETRKRATDRAQERQADLANPVNKVSLRSRAGAKGFTLIELLVVMAIIGVLLSIAAPRYFNHVEHARDNALRQSLAVMRDAIDKFHADTESYPASLEDLVGKKYLRSIPEDPHTGSRENWEVEAPPDGSSGVYDVHSGASGNTAEGTPLTAL